MNKYDRAMAAMVAALGLTAAIQAVGRPDIPDPPPAAMPELAEIPPPPPFHAPDLAQFAEIVDRPAFHRSRRPPPDSAAAAAAVSGEAAPLQPRKVEFLVMGTFISADRRIAVVRAGAGAEKALGVGDQIQGWRVTSIDAEGICVEAGGEVRTVALREDLNNPDKAKAAKRPTAGRAAPFRPKS
jgi:hypothetical protein